MIRLFGACLYCAAILLLSGPGWSQSPPVGRPGPEILGRVTTDDARAYLRSKFAAGGGLYLEKNPMNVWTDSRVEKVAVGDDRIVIGVARRENPTVEFEFSKMAALDIVQDRVMGNDVFGVVLNDKDVLWYLNSRVPADERRTVTDNVANSLYVLKNHPLFAAQDEEQFRELVEKYRGQSKPPLPEEARRFRVQAEFAVEQRRLADAAKLYGDTLKVAPWWPEGYFNRALVLSDLKRYPEAVREMKRFLALEPNHAQARAAQDQIYRWESVTGSGLSPIPQAGAASKGAEPCRTLFGCARQEAQR